MHRLVSAVLCAVALAACANECAPLSRWRHQAPVISEFVLVPMGSSPIEETNGLVDVLARRFPGLKFRLEPQVALPDGVLNDQGQVVARRLISKLPKRPGTIAIIGLDLTSPGMNFLYGSMDPATSNGVVSVSRFRTAEGYAAPEDAALSPGERALASSRLQNQVTSTLAKSFGMSFPCQERKCVLRYPRMMSEFDDKGGEFCPAHAAEFARIMASRSTAAATGQ